MRDHKKDDRMESFFLAETTKYLYLLFDHDNFMHNLGQHGTVFNTPWGECIIDAGGYFFNTGTPHSNLGLKNTNLTLTYFIYRGSSDRHRSTALLQSTAAGTNQRHNTRLRPDNNQRRETDRTSTENGGEEEAKRGRRKSSKK